MKFKDFVRRGDSWEDFEHWLEDMKKLDDMEQPVISSPHIEKIGKKKTKQYKDMDYIFPFELYNVPIPSKYGKLYSHRIPYEYGDEAYKEWKKYKINTVVSLVEWNEKRFYKKGNVQLLHNPIKDYSIPYDIDRFQNTIEKIINLLRRKKNVSVHCMGGHGRTGMVIAILHSVLNNIPMYKTIPMIRKIRPKYIETKEQESFVYDFVEIFK